MGELLGRLHRLDADPATSCATVTSFLRGLDAEDADARATADREAHRVTAARAPEVAAVLTGLAGLHAADDRERSIDDWRRRMAVMNGTQVTTLRRVQAAVAAAGAVAAEWRAMRAVVVGGAWSDRRAGLPAPQVKLETHAAVAAAALGAAVPALAGAAVHEAGRVRTGDADRTVVEADGRVSATVNHRPTPRGGLMVAHELGHAVHAALARGTLPPGPLVGETVACWAALVAGLAAVDHADNAAAAAAAALALGDMLVEELFVSAAVSAFEDSLHAAMPLQEVEVGRLNELWRFAHVHALGDEGVVPEDEATGWARLPALATQPGHALAYCWATLLAQAMEARAATDPSGRADIAAAVALGGVDADQLVAALGLDVDAWADEGMEALTGLLRRLAQVVRSGESPAPGSTHANSATTGS